MVPFTNDESSPVFHEGSFIIYDTSRDKYLINSADRWTPNHDLAMLHDRQAAQDTVRRLNGAGMPSLKGLELKVGGEWARNLYDEKVPNFLNKYAKRWGAKVGQSEIRNNEHVILKPMTAGQYWEEIEKPVGMVAPRNPDKYVVVVDMGEGEKVSQTGPDSFASKADAEAYATKKNQESGAFTKVHSIEITPAMKKSVMKEGQPISKNTALPAWTQGAQDALAA